MAALHSGHQSPMRIMCSQRSKNLTSKSAPSGWYPGPDLQVIRPHSRTASATRSATLAESAQKATHPRSDIDLSQSSWPGVGRLPDCLVSISQWRALGSTPHRSAWNFWPDRAIRFRPVLSIHGLTITFRRQSVIPSRLSRTRMDRWILDSRSGGGFVFTADCFPSIGVV